jgi:hypothetical protein
MAELKFTSRSGPISNACNVVHSTLLSLWPWHMMPEITGHYVEAVILDRLLSNFVA